MGATRPAPCFNLQPDSRTAAGWLSFRSGLLYYVRVCCGVGAVALVGGKRMERQKPLPASSLARAMTFSLVGWPIGMLPVGVTQSVSKTTAPSVANARFLLKLGWLGFAFLVCGRRKNLPASPYTTSNTPQLLYTPRNKLPDYWGLAVMNKSLSSFSFILCCHRLCAERQR